MQAHEVMSQVVHAVQPETPVREVVRLMVDRNISGVPVVDAQRHVVGMISERDFLHRGETGTQSRGSWWLALLTDSRTRAREIVLRQPGPAEELITRGVPRICGGEELDHRRLLGAGRGAGIEPPVERSEGLHASPSGAAPPPPSAGASAPPASSSSP